MSKYQTPYRYDFVGSFLRPQEVKQAKADYSEGKITKEECDAVVDKAVTEVVAKQKELGFHIIQMGNSEELTGTWTSCGDLKVLATNRQERVYSSMRRWQRWKTLI